MIGIKDLMMRSLIYSLFVKYFLPKHKLAPDQIIEDMAGTRYKVEVCYYTTDLQPVVVASDAKGEMRSFPESHIEAIND